MECLVYKILFTRGYPSIVLCFETLHTADSVIKTYLRRAITPSYLIECMSTVIIHSCLYNQPAEDFKSGWCHAGEERLPVQRERTF